MLSFFEILCLALCLQTINCRPTDDPTKYSLSSSSKLVENAEKLEKNGPTMFQKGMELLGSIADKIRFGRGRFVNSVILIRNILKDGGEDWLEQIADVMRFGNGRINSATMVGNNFIDQNEEATSETQNAVKTVILPKNDPLPETKKLASYEKVPFANFFPPKTRETARLENEKDQAFFEKPRSNPIEGILEKFLRPTPLIDGIKEEQKYGNSGDQFIVVGRALVNGFEGLSNFLNAAVDFPVKAAKNTSYKITEALNQLGSRLVGLQ